MALLRSNLEYTGLVTMIQPAAIGRPSAKAPTSQEHKKKNLHCRRSQARRGNTRQLSWPQPYRVLAHLGTRRAVSTLDFEPGG